MVVSHRFALLCHGLSVNKGKETLPNMTSQFGMHGKNDLMPLSWQFSEIPVRALFPLSLWMAKFTKSQNLGNSPSSFIKLGAFRRAWGTVSSPTHDNTVNTVHFIALIY